MAGCGLQSVVNCRNDLSADTMKANHPEKCVNRQHLLLILLKCYEYISVHRIYYTELVYIIRVRGFVSTCWCWFRIVTFRSLSIVTRHRAGRPRFYSTRVPGGSWIKQPGRKADHSPHTSPWRGAWLSTAPWRRIWAVEV